MNICVIGSGYVGLVTGTCLSDFGMNVTCVDKDQKKIDLLNQGEVPIYEIGLKELIARNVKLERLKFSSDIAEGIRNSLVIFIGVGTPELDDGSTDMRYVHDCAKIIAENMTEYKVIVIKSTVPVGTAKEIRKIISENQKSKIEFDVVSNPEFLREGSAIDDFLRPNRVVLGASNEKSLAIVKDIYRPLYLLETPIVCTSNETAELIKYASNTMLALKISFINEIANLCEKVGADVYQVAVAVGMDQRIGSKFLHPGPGFGGSCFPKDVKSIVHLSNNQDYEFLLGQAVIEVNQRQKESIVKKIQNTFGDLNGKTITLLGLAFKSKTDDVREAPALYVAERLLGEGAKINTYDPEAMENSKKVLDGLNYFKNAYDACKDSDMVVIITEWHEFRDLNFEKIKGLVKTPIVYDTRNIYNPQTIVNLGYKYLCTGRPIPDKN